MQNVLILIAPALMAASIYMILGRIILLTDGERYALVKRRWLTKLFVTGDVISLMMQASGTFRRFPSFFISLGMKIKLSNALTWSDVAL